jgi:hypothetical protein
MAKRPTTAFREARTLTPAAAAKARADAVMRKMEELMTLRDERDFIEGLSEFLELKPGEPRYEAALKIWRSSQPKP